MTLYIAGLSLLFLSTLLAIGLIRSDNPFIRKVSLWLTILSCISFVIPAGQVIIDDRTLSAALYQAAPGMEFSFLIDRLSAFFILVISVVSISAAVYSMRYIEEASHGIRRGLFIPLMNAFILSMLLFVASDNAFSQLTFWELMSLTSFLLVMFNYEKEETRRAGLFYFIMTQMSTVFLIIAFVIIHNITGSFDIQTISGLSPVVSSAIFLLLFTGFSIKAGIIPFHKWLPYAHSSSPSNISALMSGVMIKVAVYGLMRYILTVLDPEPWWGMLILISGTLSALLGVIYALKEHDIKRLLAYHSIENIGIIFIGFGLFVIFQEYGFSDLAFMSLAASLFHTINHAIFKSLLFLAAGSIVEQTGTRNMEKMGGLVKSMPYTAVLFLIGSISISALPPMNGFVSELMIFQAFFQSFSIADPVNILMFICLSLFALTSALAAACFVKAFGIIFLAMPRSEKAQNAREVSRYMLIGPGILALLCLILGLLPYQIFQFLGYTPPIPNMLAAFIMLLVFMLLGIAVMLLLVNRQSRTAETWSCGLPAPGPQTEYTAAGFSEPILTFFKPIYRTRKSLERNFWDKYQSIFKNGSAEINVMRVFEENVYLPIANSVRFVSKKISGAHNVDLDTFILYSFVTIIILLIIMGWML